MTHKPEDLSSTDRLLSLIRKSSDEPKETSLLSLPVPEKKPLLKRYFRKKGGEVVGVDFDNAYLRLIRIRLLTDGQQEIAAFRIAPLGNRIEPYTPAFATLLRAELSRICNGVSDIEIWGLLPPEEIRFHQFSLPKDSAKQMEQTIFLRFKGETGFDEEKDILDYQFIEGVSPFKEMRSLDVLAFSAARQQIERVRRLFSGAGFPLSGLSASPFALQNFFTRRWLEPGEDCIGTVHIGRRWTVINIHLLSGKVHHTRTIRASLDSMILAVKEHLQRYPDDQFSDAKRGGDENDHAENIFFLWIRQSIQSGISSGEAPSERLVEILLPTWDRLSGQINRTFHRFSTAGAGRNIGRVNFFGEIALSLRFRRYMEERLEMPVTAPDLYASALFDRTIDREEFSLLDRPGSIPALGIALSDGLSTPNFLCPSHVKRTERRMARINQLVIKASVLLLAVCIGIAFWQSHLLGNKYQRVESLRRQLTESGPRWTTSMFDQEIERILQKKESILACYRIYSPLILLFELDRLTPSRIRLTRLHVQRGSVDPKGKFVEDGGARIEGIISGGEIHFDIDLIGYRESIAQSPLFSAPAILKKERVIEQEGVQMRFSMKMEAR